MTPESRFRERRTAFQDETGAPPAAAPEEPSAAAPPPAAEPSPVPAAEPSPAPTREESPPPDIAPPQPRDEVRDAALAQEPSEAAREPGVDLDELEQIEIPDASFLELVQPLEIQALQFLGEIPLSPAGEKRVMPRWAKHVIDLLGILEARTRGQLAEEEAQYLEKVLTELRLRYLRISQ